MPSPTSTRLRKLLETRFLTEAGSYLRVWVVFIPLKFTLLAVVVVVLVVVVVVVLLLAYRCGSTDKELVRSLHPAPSTPKPPELLIKP